MIFPVYQSLNRLKEDVQELEMFCTRMLNYGREKPFYIIGSMFLRKCYRFLVSEEPEILHFVTGIDIGNLKIMDVYGHLLLGIFHSHPGIGREWVTPSHVDIATQKRYENGGYTAVGGVFSRDGFVRFFSHNLDFEISIYGKEVKSVGDKVFHIT